MGKTLEVTHVALSLDVGGLERNIVNQVRVAGEFGQHVSVVCLERPGALAARVEDEGGKVVCVGKAPGIRLGTIGRLAAVLRDLRPDVVHTHQLATLFYGGLAARRVGTPLVVHTEHGRERYADRRRTRWLGRLGGFCASRFYCLTEDMATQVRAHGIVPREKIRVIRNGIDVARYRRTEDSGPLRRSLGIADGAPVIGTIGRLVEVKRHDLLIRAFARVKPTVPDAQLLIVGDGPLSADLKALADGLGVGGSVHLVGYQPEAWKYLHAMNLFALTSRSEGTPQALLEASVAEIPVVASAVGGVPEVVEHGRSGLLFESGDESGLTEALLKVATDPGLARDLGGAGRQRVEALFDIRRMAGDYHRDYLELLAPAANPKAAGLVPGGVSGRGLRDVFRTEAPPETPGQREIV